MQRWNGASWSIVASPNVAAQSNQLNGVTCVSTSDCWAVGSAYTSGYTFTDSSLIEHWNGSSWSIVTAPHPNAVGNSDLLGKVRCTSGSHCWAVGNVNFNTPFIVEWNGASWAAVASPRSDGAGVDTYLVDTACTSPSDCWAVGDNGTILYQSPDRALIQHWDGNAWSVMASSHTLDAQGTYLDGVTCVTSSNCWAVGAYYFQDSGGQTLIEHWDGNHWAIVSSPNASVDNSLRKVACTSASDCWAVGYYYNEDGDVRTLIQHWNGASWSIFSSPNQTPSSVNDLIDVTCSSVSNCWAVGSYTVSGIGSQVLLEHWNGSVWSVAAPPDNLLDVNYANTVACNSASDCWVAGSFETKSTGLAAFIHWDGMNWSVVASPLVGARNGIACSSSTNCWAVGYRNTGNENQPFTEHWDGLSWSFVDSPTTNSYFQSRLNGVACPSDSRCFAVGYYASNAPGSEGTNRTLIEEFTPIPPLTSVASRKMHGVAPFDVTLPGGGTGIECRSGGASGDYTVVFSFVNSLADVGAANVTGGTGSIAGSAIGSDPHQYLVNLTGVTNAQHLTVTLNNTRDSAGNIGNAISSAFNVLIADTNGDGSVNSADISQTKSQSGQGLTNSNFREDLNADGAINSADISLVKSKSGSALPPQQFRAAHSER